MGDYETSWTVRISSIAASLLLLAENKQLRVPMPISTCSWSEITSRMPSGTYQRRSQCRVTQSSTAATLISSFEIITGPCKYIRVHTSTRFQRTELFGSSPPVTNCILQGELSTEQRIRWCGFAQSVRQYRFCS